MILIDIFFSIWVQYSHECQPYGSQLIMKQQNIPLIVFILLLIGTTGLLLNEFVFDWGRTAVLIFAAANVIGLIVLVTAVLGQSRK